MVGALEVLAEEPFGQWLLGVIAFGLVAYAIHMLILARYYRLLPNEPAAGSFVCEIILPLIDCAITTAVLSYSTKSGCRSKSKSLDLSCNELTNWTRHLDSRPQQWGLLLEWHQRPNSLPPINFCHRV